MEKMTFPLLPSIKFTPLISVDTILDLDTGLINLIKEQYLDPNVFDVELLSLSDNILFSYVYFRPVYNPLYTIRNRKMELTQENMDLLDSYYTEFMQRKYPEILNHSLISTMDDVLIEFDKAKDITPAILYYDDFDLMQINTIKRLKNIRKVHIDEIDNSNKYNQIYLKYFSDSIRLPNNIRNTTYYFSNCGINVDEEMGLYPDGVECMRELTKRSNEIRIYDMYNKIIINRKYMNKFNINYDIKE